MFCHRTCLKCDTCQCELNLTNYRLKRSTNGNGKNEIFYCIIIVELEDTKEVIIIRKLKKDRQHNDQRKKNKGQTAIYKTLHRKLKTEQHEPH